MKRRIISAALVLALCLALLPTAAAAGAGLSNFKTVNTYSGNTFSDVPAQAWYAGNVRTAYELDLVKGISDSRFNPSGNMTIAATVALACRLHSIYHTGTAEFVQGSPWYQVYVDYAVKNGIIRQNQFTNYNANATRRQFAAILAHALPETALEQKNTVDDGMIPDVAAGSASCDEIYLLYRAGVLTGNDAKGTFTPEATISRYGVAAIVSRMALPSLRQSITLKDSSGDLKVSLNRSTLSLLAGKTATLTATVTPSGAKDKTVTWTSSSSSVARVSSSGVVTAVRAGTATITATASNGAKATCKVTVTEEDVEVRSVYVDPGYLTLEEGETETLSVSFYPDNATDTVVTWKSSNTGVATVSSSGKVTAVRAGTARITATAENGKSDSCSVTVKASTKPPEFSTPKLDYNYGPMTVTAYHTSGSIQYRAKVTSFLFTDAVLQSNGDVRLSATIQGTNTGPDFYVRINLFDSSGALLDTDFTSKAVGVNQDFAVQSTFTISADALEKASKIEFLSYSGDKAVDGISDDPEPTPEPETDPEVLEALQIGVDMTDVFQSALKHLEPVQEYMSKCAEPQYADNPHGAAQFVLFSIDGITDFAGDVDDIVSLCGSSSYWADVKSSAGDLAEEMADTVDLFESVGKGSDPTSGDVLRAKNAYLSALKQLNAIMSASTNVINGLDLQAG